jgi:hypothetical protein
MRTHRFDVSVNYTQRVHEIKTADYPKDLQVKYLQKVGSLTGWFTPT